MFSILNESITGRAQKSHHLALNCHNLRDSAFDKHRTVDDYPFGGEAGMVLKPEPLKTAITSITQKYSTHTVFMTPQGAPFSQKKATELSKMENILIICGHYKGIDERVRKKYIDEEISIGDYVLTGGEIPAMVLVDSVVRLIPGVLGDRDSAETDSFYQNNRLGWPVFTRPEIFEDEGVPEVLRSGHHKNIKEWQKLAALENTKNRRPDLFEKLKLSPGEKKSLKIQGTK